jgi:sec-independent protein translocase protein TatC
VATGLDNPKQSAKPRRRAKRADDEVMSFGDHLDELRRRVLLALAGPAVTFVIIWVWLRYQLMDWILRPPFPAWRIGDWEIFSLEPVPLGFSQGAPTTAFLTFATICLIAAVIAAAPWIIYHIWAFVAAGLYEHERRAVRIYGVASVVMFFAGVCFFYFLVYPVSLSFLYGFGQSFNQYLAEHYGAEPMILSQTLLEGYVKFVLLLVLVFGLMFELPLVITFLGRTGIVTTAALKRYRRHVILGLVVVSALVTPPDIFSQVALSLPMWLLYEGSIIIVRLTGPRRRRPEELAEPADSAAED